MDSSAVAGRDQHATSRKPDRRRQVPRTDAVLADERLAAALASLGRASVKAAVTAAQQQIRNGEIDSAHVVEASLALLPARPTTMRPVINASGVLLHTNLGRAPLSQAAIDAMITASGPIDLEFDLATGHRARRGRGALLALTAAVPAAEAVHVVNNNAAALVLIATTLAHGREIVISRGELVEIGDGFRLPDLLTSTGARLREVGTTNRTTVQDYAEAVGPDTAFVLKVHPSNFRVEGFTAAADVGDLTGLGVPIVVDVGSGLLAPQPLLPDEPDVDGALRAGAALVTASGDKLLGGPQAGLLFGALDLMERLRSHPLARALRADKVTLAALEATVRGTSTPVSAALRRDLAELRRRAGDMTRRLAQGGVDAVAVRSQAMVSGGGAPGVPLASAAVSLPGNYAVALRQRDPAIVGRLAKDRLLLDLRAVPPECDGDLVAAVSEIALPARRNRAEP
jgi:L-seryl-tRNA(Ser) seleniumtransferase